MRLCEFCGEEAVDGILERGGSGFVGQRYVQANDNQYLVEYRCRECGMVQGLAIEDIDDDSDVYGITPECSECGRYCEYSFEEGGYICPKHGVQ